MDRFFPIKSNTSCQLKWTWSTIRLYNGSSGSCFRVNPTTLSTETFSQFHNTEKNINDRKLMLEGKWPSGGCEYCKQIEESGGQSDRQSHLKIPNLTPAELDNEPTQLVVSPRIVEVYLDNVCNMSCIYCWEGFSSKIYQENDRFGEFSQHGVEIKNTSHRSSEFESMSKQFWEWMEQNYHHLRRLHILGGEPFYQEQFETCLQFLETHQNKDLELNIVSNLKISPDKLESIVGRIKTLIKNRKIRRLDITCSIDCWGEAQEYVRYGINLEQWKSNFEYLVDQKWIVLNINQTLTSLTIKTMPDMLKYLYSFDRSIGHYFGLAVMTYDFLSPTIFGPGFFDNDFKEILSSMTKTNWQNNEAKTNMESLWKRINAGTKSNEHIKQLSVYLDELDRRRNLDWKKTFPWLVKEVESVVQ